MADTDDPQLTPRYEFQRQAQAARRRLVRMDHALAKWVKECGPCKLEIAWERSLYEALVRAIAHQQLHGKAAETILGRFKAGFSGDGFPTAKQVSRASEEKLRGFGFSAAKVLAIKGIADAELQGQIPDRQAARAMTDDQLIQQLTELRGVGRWTVEMLLIFTLGRMDVMPVDDFGVRHGLKVLLDLPEMPTRRELSEQAAEWTPFRTIAAWYLWRRADAEKVTKAQ